MKTVLIVQARMGSTRLPGKVLMPAGGKPMLAHQIDRMRKVRFADELVIATTDEVQDDAIVVFCNSYGVQVFRGSQDDVLSRYAAAAKAYDADVIVRLTGDCPLIDPAVINEVISVYRGLFDERSYASNTLERSYPRGMDVEVFSRALLDEADREARTQYDREHVTSFLIRNDRKNIVQKNISHIKQLSAYRFTLDYLKDYVQIKALIESDLPDYTLATFMERAESQSLNLHDNAEQSQGQGQGQGQSILSRVGLGAAQFGMYYGRFNLDGVPSPETVSKILSKAHKYGLKTIDTAHLYGVSEAVLGCCAARLDQFEVFTKTPRFSDQTIVAADARALRSSFEKSLLALRLPAITGLLIHHAPNLLAPGGERLYEAMQALKSEGLVKQIGVSVYSDKTAEKINDKFPMDLVQLPINVLDQRLLTSGVLSRLAKSGVKVHARSVFLQGLLLADPATLSSHFNMAKPVLLKFHETARRAGVSPAHAALHFLLGKPEIHRIIVGVESLRQIDQLFAAFPPAPEIDFSEFAIDHPEILNPVLWIQ